METYAIIALFALLYAFLDAWHDEKVIRRQGSGLFNWHQIDAGIKATVAGMIGWLAFGVTWTAALVAVGILSIRWLVFDAVLNRLMDWGGNKKGGLDAVPFWIRGIVLVVVIILIYLTNGKD